MQLLPRTPFAPVPQQLQDEFRKLVFVGATPTRGSIFNVGHDVTAASRPVTAAVPVQVRLTNPFPMTWVEVIFDPAINAVFVRAPRTIQGRQEKGWAGGGKGPRPHINPRTNQPL